MFNAHIYPISEPKFCLSNLGEASVPNQLMISLEPSFGILTQYMTVAPGAHVPSTRMHCLICFLNSPSYHKI